MSKLWTGRLLAIVTVLFATLLSSCANQPGPLGGGIALKGPVTNRGTPTPIIRAKEVPPQSASVTAADQLLPWQLEQLDKPDLDKHLIHFRFYVLKVGKANARPTDAFGTPADQWVIGPQIINVAATPYPKAADKANSKDVYLLLGTYKDTEGLDAGDKGAGVCIFKFQKPQW